MTSRNTILLALDDADLSEALGCSSEEVQSLQHDGLLASQGQLWEIGPAQEYLRDAAWADSHWH